MKLIGVMGNGGSGKTTFSEHLDKRENVGVIHVDDLVGEIKRKYFKMFLQPKENNTTENTKSNPKLKSSSKKFFYQNKFTFKFLMLVRSKMIERELSRKIEEFKSSGKGLIVIDDWALSTHKKLFPKFNHIYTVERPYLSRRKGIQERDALTTKEAKVNDLPYALGFLKTAVGENTSIIKNEGTIKELQNRADLEYERLGELTFDEKYNVRDKANLRNVTQNLTKLSCKEKSETIR
jgi:dephospho-CoA kinase